MERFIVGQTVIFRESATGPVERGTIVEAIKPDSQYPHGGLYFMALADGTGVEAWADELTAA